jgi:hypothetical protein
MLVPFVVIVFIEHFVALSWLTWNTDLEDIGIRFRSIISSILQYEPQTIAIGIGIGIVLPAFGFGLVVIAWSSMLVRRLIGKKRPKPTLTSQVLS